MTSSLSPIAANYHDVMRRIESACRQAGRSPEEVTLVAVTKSADVDAIRELVSLGVHELGESRPQQLIERAALVSGGVCWHMIGHLQTNKARRLLPVAKWIHSVDTLRLLTRIDVLADELQLQPCVLLEVNISGEASKHGFTPDELSACWTDVVDFQHVDVAGLMTMAPLSDDPEESRPVFRRLRELRDSLNARMPARRQLSQLSMGMSQDFEVAIEEGATLVRVGSALFES